MTALTTTKNEPVLKERLNNWTVSIFANKRKTPSGAQFVEYSIDISRSYKDKTGAWKNTSRFGPADMPTIKALMQEAEVFVEAHS